MDINKIESFLMLAETQNFAKASDRLFISQPALSKRIQALEDELGVPLFHRMGHRTFLTVQGEALRRYAEEIVASYYNAREYIKQIENMEHGTLNFGATNFIGIYLMPQVIARFQALHPNIEIDMVINTSRNILEMLHRNRLEFVFLSDYIIAEPEQYIARKYLDDELKLIVGRGHPLFGRERCSLFDVGHDLYLTKEPQSSQYRFLDRIFKRFGFDFRRKLFISSQEAIKEAVLCGAGVSILSERTVAREAAAGLVSVLALDETPIRREIQYVCIRNKLLTPAAKGFIRLLREGPHEAK